MDNEGSQEKQERQEQQIAGPRLQALETEDDEAWAQRQREVAQARTDRTEDWTGTYLHEYAALAPPGPLPLVADGDISPLRLDEGTSSPEHGENDYNGMEISDDEEEEADGLSDYTWGDESEDGGVPLETNGLSDLTWGDDSEHAEDSAESEIGKEEEEEEEAAAMAEGSSKRKREMDPDNDVASKRVCVP